MSISYMNVQLNQFEGPLSLLLYLIRKEEMDIFDIKIHEITNQYFEYIRLMKEFDLELAGEFIAMAATLIQIKSKMLLPQYNENGDVLEAEDPRKELVQKLLEYQKYQEASRLLGERPWLGRDIFPRGAKEDIHAEEETQIELEENALFGLITSYRKILKFAKRRIHNVAEKIQSISNRILEIKNRLVVGERITLRELITSVEDQARQILITFLSMLELGKLGFVDLYQTEAYADIYIHTKKPIENDVIANVEEYDSVYSEDVANKLFASETKEKSEKTEKAMLVDADDEEEKQFEFADLDDAADTELSDSTEDIATDEEILFAEQELNQEFGADDHEEV